MDKYYARVVRGTLTHLIRHSGDWAYALKYNGSVGVQPCCPEDANKEVGEEFTYRAISLKNALYYHGKYYRELSKEDYIKMRISGVVLDDGSST